MRVHLHQAFTISPKRIDIDGFSSFVDINVENRNREANMDGCAFVLPTECEHSI